MESINSEDIVQFCAITSVDPDVANTYLTVCEGSLERAITLFMESGGIDLAETPSSTSNNINRGERRSRTSSNDGSAGGFGGSFDQDEELARSLQEEDANAAEAIRAPIAPKHEMLLSEDYSEQPTSMFGSSS
ncbi:hypothetical protein BGX27_001862, partial [Mortierella sp. AM989]